MTISLDDETYRNARIAAAERGMSASALVRDCLQKLKPAPVAKPEMSMRELLNWAAQTGNYSASERYTREQLYDRDFMRQEHERGLAWEAAQKAGLS